jgi:isoquinoline 1-oxidoreductase beta subunit
MNFPIWPHAPMEPMNCVVQLRSDGCEIWNGCQSQTLDQAMVAALLGIKPEQIKINTLYAGGSFGRRASTKSDYVLEAVNIAKAINGRAPVKLVWTREDDMRAGFYRPQYLHRVSAGLDAAGQPIVWHQRIVGQSIFGDTYAARVMVKDGVDQSSVEGAVNMPYPVPHCAIELHTTKTAVPVLYWRSVGSTHTAYVAETMIDELAHLSNRDPLDYRRELLKDHPRHLGVLALAAKQAGWDKPLKPGRPGERRGRGIAVHEAFRSFVAQVAEVTVQKDGSFKVDRVVCAVDCGVAVNPDVVAAQMQGGINFGLSAAISGAITLKDGVVEQSNFDEYQVLRLNQAPRIEVHIVPSAAAPTGVGEPGVPPIAPAVANALFAATKKRLRRLPFDTTLLRV